jgi:hypothetical protein
MSDAQRADSALAFGGINNAGLLDFVAAWYVKAARYMANSSPFKGEAGRGMGSNAAPSKTHPHPNLPLEGEGTIALPSSRGKLEGGWAEGEGMKIRAAFVSTNSITQGEQVGALWGWLLAQGIKIHFAHRTFSWSNEARGNAAVHCVIVGFGLGDVAAKTIFEYEDIKGEAHAVRAANINPYLVDAPDVVLPRRSKPVCEVPEIGIGNKPIDGGQYLFTPEEKAAFVAREPAAAPFFRRWIGADEFINGYERWCLWLGDCPPEQLRAMPEAMKRVQAVKVLRLASKSSPTQKLADTPTRFHVENMPTGPYLVLPEVSSERRLFIPIGFEPPETFASNLVKIAPNATLFHFGILTSTMHNAWVRAVCGRLKSDYRYSASIVYNNFPWPQTPSSSPLSGGAQSGSSPVHTPLTRGDGGVGRPGGVRLAAIETAAQAILDARAQFPGATLADLYDPLTMPPALLKAHQALDKAVDAAYGKTGFKSEAERVAFLFERYQQLTSLLPAVSSTRKKRRQGENA